MVDENRFKRKSLGTAPPLESASDNLSAPEIAPASKQEPLAHTESQPVLTTPPQQVVAPIKAWRDGRAIRATGRVHQICTKVRAETKQMIAEICERDGILIAELFELAIAAYERERNKG